MIAQSSSLALMAGMIVALCVTPVTAAVTISTDATANMNCVSGVCTPSAADAVLNVGDLTTMLASGNVTVNTGTGSLPQQVEDIIVAAPFNWASANGLTLDAYRSVTVDQPVADNGSGAVTLTTNDGGSGGNLLFMPGGSLSFLGTTNGLSINGQAYTLENSIAALAAAIKLKASGRYALSASYNARNNSTYKKSPIPTKFKGTLNGLGNVISNLTIRSRRPFLGLFAYLTPEGVINSLALNNVNISANRPKERTSSQSGAFVGVSYGTIFNSFASGQMTVNVGNFGVVAGGLIGSTLGTVVGSASTIKITAVNESSDFVGEIGGLVGANLGTIDTSYATGDISLNRGDSSDVAGLAGANDGVIENCYAEGSVAVPEGATQVGGFLGGNGSTIASSYSTGAPTAGNGGVVGGFIGGDISHGGLSDDYWDTTTSGITNLSQGAGNVANDPGITGETTTQLQSGLPAGFDPTIWAESPSINNGFPYLIANPPQ